MTGQTYAIEAYELEKQGNEGRVYGPLSLSIPRHGFTALVGSSGSGRTALSLTLAGRMRPGSGTLTVLGHQNRRAIRERVAIAGVEQADLLERDARIVDLLTEYRAWSSPWYRWVRRGDDDYLRELAGEVYGQRSLPPLQAYVSQVSELDKHLLRMAFALHPAHGRDVEMLIVDDIDQIPADDERRYLLLRLLAISERIPVLATVVNPLPMDLVPAARQLTIDVTHGHYHPANIGRSNEAKGEEN